MEWLCRAVGSVSRVLVRRVCCVCAMLQILEKEEEYMPELGELDILDEDEEKCAALPTLPP